MVSLKPIRCFAQVAAIAVTFFRFRRQPNRPIAPRPVANRLSPNPYRNTVCETVNATATPVVMADTLSSNRAHAPHPRQGHGTGTRRAPHRAWPWLPLSTSCEASSETTRPCVSESAEVHIRAGQTSSSWPSNMLRSLDAKASKLKGFAIKLTPGSRSPL